MAHIKCRCSIPYCTYCGHNTRQIHDDYWWCDSNDGCECGAYSKPEGSTKINPLCEYCVHKYGEFEKDAKQYEYINGTLKMGQKIFYPGDIAYLEIDGRILVGEKEKN